MSKKNRKHRSVEEKAELLKKHHLEKQAVSAVCEEAGVQPSLFYYWQKQLFENAPAALGGTPRPSSREKELEARIAQLEAKLAKKDGVIVEISEEFVRRKKERGEP